MAKKMKIPKRLAGVKIPKALRRGLRDFARSQTGKAVLAEALLAAGGVLVAHEAQPGSRTRTAIAEGPPAVKAKAQAVKGEARSWMADGRAFEHAARAFIDALKDSRAPDGSSSTASL